MTTDSDNRARALAALNTIYWAGDERDYPCTAIELMPADIIETIKAALEQQSGWQSMDSAPRDGAEIMVINGNEGGYCTEPYQMGIAEWRKCLGREQWASTVCCDGVSNFKPTHWKPLGPPPETL